MFKYSIACEKRCNHDRNESNGTYNLLFSYSIVGSQQVSLRTESHGANCPGQKVNYSCEVRNGDRLEWHVTLSRGIAITTVFSISEARQSRRVHKFSSLGAVFTAINIDADNRRLESTLVLTLTRQMDHAMVTCDSHDSRTGSSDSETIFIEVIGTLV